jgi:hypothetical protein
MKKIVQQLLSEKNRFWVVLVAAVIIIHLIETYL